MSKQEIQKMQDKAASEFLKDVAKKETSEKEADAMQAFLLGEN